MILYLLKRFIVMLCVPLQIVPETHRPFPKPPRADQLELLLDQWQSGYDEADELARSVQEDYDFYATNEYGSYELFEDDGSQEPCEDDMA